MRGRRRKQEGERVVRAWVFVTRRYFSSTPKESIFYVDREKRATCPSWSPGYSRLNGQKHRLIPGTNGEAKGKGRRKLCCTTEFIEKMELLRSWRLLRRGWRKPLLFILCIPFYYTEIFHAFIDFYASRRIISHLFHSLFQSNCKSSRR